MRILPLIYLHRFHLSHRGCYYTSVFAVFFSEDHRLVFAPVFRILGQMELNIVFVEAADDVVHDLLALAWRHAG